MFSLGLDRTLAHCWIIEVNDVLELFIGTQLAGSDLLMMLNPSEMGNELEPDKLLTREGWLSSSLFISSLTGTYLVPFRKKSCVLTRPSRSSSKKNKSLVSLCYPQREDFILFERRAKHFPFLASRYRFFSRLLNWLEWVKKSEIWIGLGDTMGRSYRSITGH